MLLLGSCRGSARTPTRGASSPAGTAACCSRTRAAGRACIGPRVLAAVLDDATYAELSGAQAECIREGAEEAEQRVCVVCLDEPADYMCLPAATSAAARTASSRLAGPATAAVPSAAPGPTRSSVCSASTQEGDERRREDEKREERGSGASVSQRQQACGSDGDNRKERERGWWRVTTKKNGFTVVSPHNLSSVFCAGQKKHMRRGEARGEIGT